VKRHLFPKKVAETQQGDVFEEWIYYGTDKLSGKRLILKPGQHFFSVEPGVHNIFVWKGAGKVGGVRVEAGAFDLNYCDDELLVVHSRAVAGHPVENTGTTDLVLFKFFGPDIHRGRTPRIGHGLP
jgi:hypothetical protein